MKLEVTFSDDKIVKLFNRICPSTAVGVRAASRGAPRAAKVFTFKKEAKRGTKTRNVNTAVLKLKVHTEIRVVEESAGTL